MSVAERLDHPALAAAKGRPVDAAACTDRAKMGVLLQGAAVLSLCDAGGWTLARGWEGAAVDSCGRLSGLAASPGRPERTAQEHLRELLLQLFRGETRIAGRGEARSAARELLAAWEGALAPMASDEAIGRIFDAAAFLWDPEFAAVRELLRGFLVRGGVEVPWLAGPAEVRLRLAGAGRRGSDGAPTKPAPRDPRVLLSAGRWSEAVRSFRERPPTDEASTLLFAEALLGCGRFEAALLLLADREDVAALTVVATCRLLLGELPQARDLVHALDARDLNAAERIAAGDTALRVLALSGEPAAAADWAAAALARSRSGAARQRAQLLVATAALDRGDLALAKRHLEAAEEGTAAPHTSRARHEARVWLRLAESDGSAVVAESRALLGSRREMRRFEAGRAWNNLGLGYLMVDDFARAERAFQHSARLLRLCDGPLAITLSQWNLAEVRLRSGKLLEVEPILRASMTHNRRSGNRRGLAVDEALWIRLELVRGRPEAALERHRLCLAEQVKWGLDYHRPELAALAARALGWLERPVEAADQLIRVDAAGLGELEPEELPALFALAGNFERARAEAQKGAFAALWLPVLRGDAPPDDAFELLDGLRPGGRLPPFRRARLLLDLELTLPGSLPRTLRDAAATIFRRLGATRFAAILTRGEAGLWTALRDYLVSAPGDRSALAELFRAVGAPEAELVWSDPAGDRVWLEGGGPALASAAELLAESAGGSLRLRATRIDEVLRAVFALAVREIPTAGLQADRTASGMPSASPGSATKESGAAGLIGASPLLAQAQLRLRQFGASDMPVLILGESGSGKELAAREVRRASDRAGAPWVPVNCAALSETLLLSDLFGHARGAFTGADRAHAGVFETANGGTVFLDEIGDLPPAAQGNLLRVLQEGEVRRLGESMARKVDVRLVAATHRDLAAMVVAGKFRQDLYYRLKVCTVTMPPLRDRGDDRLLLAEHFLAALRCRRELPQLQLASDARRLIEMHSWPGNVRELEHALQAAAALAGNGPIRAEMLDLGATVDGSGLNEGSAYHRELDDFRRALLHKALRGTNGNRAEAARRLGLSRQALSYLVRQLGLEEEPGARA
ncbi:MAG: sigma 54-interacting transcriptional regulator [Thermoanaerobaculia bacterium]